MSLQGRNYTFSMTITQAPFQQVPLHKRAIRYVKGVGPSRMVQLAQLGIETIEDACYYAPHRYEDRTTWAQIRDLDRLLKSPQDTQAAQKGADARRMPQRLRRRTEKYADEAARYATQQMRLFQQPVKMQAQEWVTIRATVLKKNIRRTRRGQTLVEALLGDSSGVLSCLWFHVPYLANQLKVGEELICYGRIETGARPQMIHPEIEHIEAGEDTFLHMGRIVPVYSVMGNLTQRWFRSFIAAVLNDSIDEAMESLPESMRQSRNWPPLAQALRMIHFPSSWKELEAAKERLAFEELLWLQLGLAQRRVSIRSRQKPQRYIPDGPLTQRLRERLPFRFTPAQQQVLDELLDDLQKPYPMQRLLQGEVGCGKTIVVITLMAVAVQSQAQAALMVPTEPLAEQQARVIQDYLGPLGVSVELLSQAIPSTRRQKSLEAIAAGKVSIVVGTHALIQQSVSFQKLSLVIIDEQHKFGVVQRADLAKKGHDPDVLVMTATPIPRTLALSIYGDLAVSTITELPPGRHPIQTFWMRESQRQEVYATIRKQLAAGRQGYVVYPLVETTTASDSVGSEFLTEDVSKESVRRSLSPKPTAKRVFKQASLETLFTDSPRNLKAASQMVTQLKQVFPEFNVGLLHGQMKSKQKEEVLKAFARGEIQLLVCTVIVEVGLDVANATLMVIEHPERFGLAQLHQLRGRIGRGPYPGKCILISDVTQPPAGQRLQCFVENGDGFQLAEKDLQQRGPGQLLGRDQHGWMRLRIADLLRDRSLLELARQEAAAIIDRDPKLSDPSLRILRERMARLHRPRLTTPLRLR